MMNSPPSQPQERATRERTGRSGRPEVYTNVETLLNEVDQLSSTSSQRSASSSNIQAPLLPPASGQQGLPSSLPTNNGAYVRGRSITFSPNVLFKEALVYAEKVLHLRKQHQSKGGRHVKVDANRMKPLVDERTGKVYVGNGIRSNKYTLWTFVPRQLLAQFSKLANFYLLCFAILQLIPGLSTTGNYTNIIPLMVFVSISMAKEGFDDYRRHRLDKEENRRETLTIDTAIPFSAGSLNWRKAQWHSLRVGDIVKLKRDEPVPADIVLIGSTSLGENKTVYVETIALDGETNLKVKRTVTSVAETCATPEKFIACSVEFVTEDPNPNLSTFRGRVMVNDQTSHLTNDNIIYRGSVLRNTPEVTAMIIYSGEECKVRVNANGNRHARIKAPRLQVMLNKVVILVVFLVIGLSIYNTAAYEVWRSNVESKLFYLSSAIVPFHQEVFGFIIMFATMVPLSLYVSMEMIKLAQIFFLNTDIDMYDERSNTPFEARTSTINEDLGQVTHIFSDKTGTLTENKMKFRKLYIDGTQWVHEDTEVPSQNIVGAGTQSPLNASIRASRTQPEVKTTTKQLVNYLTQKPNSAFVHRAKLMLLCMTLCHSCVPETTGNRTAIDFQASSPDELALVRAAQEMGFLVCRRDHETITLALSSPSSTTTTEIYEVLNVIDFSNERKRMSVIVRFPDKRICVICKGADSVVIERLERRDVDARQRSSLERYPVEDPSASREDSAVPGAENSNILLPLDAPRTFSFSHPRCSITNDDEETSIRDDFAVPDSQSAIDKCIQSINSFANESLRTLLYAYRFLDEKEYAEWRKVWDAATTSLSNHEKMVEDAANLIEMNFKLAGATGIEDKLQEGVLESINKLCRANIKIWMLTGDKQETAINIGHSCGLMKADSKIFVLNDENGSGDMRERISSSISTLRTTTHSVVVVDGHTLTTIYNESSGPLEAMFFDLVILADSVICCRAQPSQKARLVNSMRKRVPTSVTLAVGDGANDIAMIQEAHVGIGITGNEGFQAARSSDYSIAQFRFLQKLLLVHGRWNYIRTCKYILGTLWKEVVFFLTQALFQRWNGYTGTSLYEPWSLTTFNTLFTSLPVLVIGIFEKDLAASTLMAVPELYRTMGQKNRGFNIWIYFGWTMMAVAEAMIIYFCMLTLFAKAETTKDNTLFSMGDLDFVAVVVVISMKLQIIEMHNKSIVALLSVFLSVGAAFLWNIILAGVYPLTTPYKVRGGFFEGFGQNPTWWMTLIFIIICVYVFEFSVSAFRIALFPTDTDVYQQLEHDKTHKEWFERAAALESRKRRNGYSNGLVIGEIGAAIPLENLHGIS
ncbi:MAG: hypothetical protein M1822_006532 [Bathelium mastoideum]|nr:MAG: hypothetical protein M1822_006532 [Bathelium mastoideum]